MKKKMNLKTLNAEYKAKLKKGKNKMENKKVDLDKTYEIWKNKNEEHFKEKFLDTHNFYEYLEEEWRTYQKENGLRGS